MAPLALAACSTTHAPIQLRGVPESVESSALGDPVLRSAGLLRERGGLDGDRAAPEAERARLVAHFDRVLAILAAQSDASLDRAAAQLGDPDARDRLAERRAVQIDRLRAYRDASRFPLNEEDDAPVRPIFVDAHDTACAVGWLMLQDGWDAEVGAIALADNHVYGDDIGSGPLLDWVATSGLTREEAALIQPGYAPPDVEPNTFDALLAGGSFTRAGLRYENFSLERVSPTLTLSQCLQTPDAAGCHTATDPNAISPLNAIGAAAGAGYIASRDLHTAPSTLSNWLYLGVDGPAENSEPYSPYPYSGPLGSQPATCFTCTSYSAVRVSFDVIAVDADFGIGAAAFVSNPYFNFNVTHPYDNDPALNALHSETSLVFRSTFTSAGGTLGNLIVGERLADNYYYSEQLGAYDSVSFAPVQQLSVTTTAYLLDDNWAMTGFFHEFQLGPVPEPGTAALLAAGLVGLALETRRQRAARETSRGSIV